MLTVCLCEVMGREKARAKHTIKHLLCCFREQEYKPIPLEVAALTTMFGQMSRLGISGHRSMLPMTTTTLNLG